MDTNQYADYTCSALETWDMIAFKAYGDPFLFTDILEANRQYADVITFDGGEIVKVPVKANSPFVRISTPFAKGATIVLVPSPWST